MAAVVDGTSLTIYLDGVSVLSTTMTGSIVNDSREFSFGSDSTGTPYSGLIDDVRLYSTALSPGQILSLANGNRDTTQAGALDINGDYIQSGGTFTAPAGFMTLGGDLDHSSGVFTNNSGTVVLDGALQNISGVTTFNNFTKSVTTADTITFADTDLITIDGLLTLTGAASQLLTIRSNPDGAPDTQWEINHQGTESVSYIDLKDGGCDGVSTEIVTTNSIDSGNNDSCWIFDDVPPTGTITYDGGNGVGANFDINIQGDNDFTLTGTASDTATGDSGVTSVEVSLDGGGTWFDDSSVPPVVDTSGVSSWATWSYDAVLADGENQVRIRITDGIGNIGTYSTNSITTDGTDGAQDITYLFLTIGTISDYIFGPVSPDVEVNLDNTMSVHTNSQTGYQISVQRQNPVATMQSVSSFSFPDLADWISTAGGNAEIWSVLTKGLGFRLMFTGDAGAYNATYWGADDTAGNAKFAGFPSTFEAIILDSNAKTSAGSPYVSDLQLQLEADNTVPADSYSGTIEVNAIVNP